MGGRAVSSTLWEGAPVPACLDSLAKATGGVGLHPKVLPLLTAEQQKRIADVWYRAGMATRDEALAALTVQAQQ